MALTLAITGGTGFVGGHAIASALSRGHRVRALARRPQAEKPGLTWIAGSLTDAPALTRLVEGADAILHIAGVTNAPNRAGFEEGNILGTAFLRRAAGSRPLVHVSSLSAREPRLSTYGWSKLMGEQVARGSAGPVAVVRPPGVYGPGDREYLELMKTAKSGFIPYPRNSRTSMIYGPDLAQCLIGLSEEITGPARSAGRIYEVDDGAGGYTPQQVAAAIGTAIGRPVRALEVGPALLHMAAATDSAYARLKRAQPRLTQDRAAYMCHPDWSADSASLLALGIWQPETSLPQGMAATAAAYRAAGLLG
ncbi:NAD(P)-dependent oxidoreductase [Sandaracinobacter sp. RS1-74]|uniref:NAD-dependent epimerase/dehydratase family protein n=1 Tax=Sandaracinobacteroides sayramensis TaxID=2913411 RepID=UPI001EDC8F2E|nr:NAD(P)-dependent oxidoreductase [Sandaracinobacteroides sayramensis]MCG2841064.1 NAD(P)-dependent oxidoreductase [Sandaracinobacteroides sayramensis]